MKGHKVVLTTCEKNKIGVDQLVDKGGTTSVVRKVVSYREDHEQGNPVESEAVSLNVQKKRKLYRSVAQDLVDEFKQASESVQNDTFDKDFQQMKLNFPLGIERLKEKLVQFESHVLSLERELQEAQKEIGNLRSSAGKFSKLHIAGKCECQNYFSSRSLHIPPESVCFQDTNLSLLLTNMKAPAGSVEVDMYSFSRESECKERDKNTTITNTKSKIQKGDIPKENVKVKDIPGREESSRAANSRYWTAEEHKRFLEALSRFGRRDLKALSDYVGTRSIVQCRTHMQKYFLRLMRESSNSNILKHYQDNIR